MKTAQIIQWLKKSEELKIWDFGNKVLYDLCKKFPKHEKKEVIIAKTWLIGRSYAAAIERRKTNNNEKNENFYAEVVAPKILKRKIDDWIKEAKETSCKTDILRIHKKVMDLFNEISELDKRSLASKYLHFHVPDKFYIYDGRSNSSIGRVLEKFEIKKFKRCIKDFQAIDKDYSLFYEKCDFVKEKIKETLKKELSHREVDNLLLTIAGEKKRKKSKIRTRTI